MTMTAYSIEVPDTPAIAGETKPRIDSINVDGKLTTNMEGVNNMHDNLLLGMKRAGPDAQCFGYRPMDENNVPGPYKWMTFREVKDSATDIGSGFTKLGAGSKSRVGIFSPNCIQWSLVDHGCCVYGQISVPMYDTLGMDAVKHMAEETEMAVVTISPEKLVDFLKLWPDLPLVKTVVVFGKIPRGSGASVPEGAQLMTLDDLKKLGKDGGHAPLPEVAAVPSDPYTICYTSGTTGKPKGAVLSHMCFLSTVNAARNRIRHGHIPTLDNSDVHLSILPLAHCLERCIHAVFSGHGARIGFNQGDVRKVVEDIGELRPTVLVGVPRIFNRIHDQVWSQVNARGGIASSLFSYAHGVKRANLKTGSNTHWLWDRVVFKAVRERFGGRLRLVISGAAPISADVLDFLRVTLSTTVLEGYGMTEVTGPSGVTYSCDMQAGSVGPPLGNTMYKLVSVPDMDYTVDDMPNPRGELYIKGYNTFTEYYKQPELTAETINADGWIATGDIGTFNEQGNFVVIDRRKNMFKLAQGEYVTPERIEIIYTDCPLIEQIYIHGDSLQSTLVAILVPNEEFLRREVEGTAAISDRASKPLADLCKDQDVIQLMMKNVKIWGQKNDLKGFEIPKAVYLESDPFSVENNIMTPTFKVKRAAAKAHYLQIIAELYAKSNTVSA
ncbi:medium-chain fatty acid-CoA ligase faa2 [Coemansia guatemalensis]|uniref:Medium-chain fatty acid-CoA ligase faa2 n=1 Tax=Coemansia guatemalensis TaxID=2761395 RepID=A0A9W8I1V7_9FUNG|nr:medium-chain fatty acid-CoA ligase faa2 [Coemansia guatemalensis]